MSPNNAISGFIYGYEDGRQTLESAVLNLQVLLPVFVNKQGYTSTFNDTNDLL
jgi:hypothetical protein